jgi:protein-S-isoprenylcysteine O-methyltransferase Ste14
MTFPYRYLILIMWLVWAAYWWLAAYGAKSTDRREPVGSRLLHVLPLLLAGWLLWAERVPGAFLNEPMFPWAPWTFWTGALITAAGLGFAIWARVYLGRNWSGTVTIKQDHELIVSGPYAIVRHPIYTGLLLAMIGTAMARGQWRGLFAVLIAWAALWRKLRVEERWMTERFGQKYEVYRRRVPALLPFAGGHKAERSDAG